MGRVGILARRWLLPRHRLPAPRPAPVWISAAGIRCVRETAVEWRRQRLSASQRLESCRHAAGRDADHVGSPVSSGWLLSRASSGCPHPPACVVPAGFGQLRPLPTSSPETQVLALPAIVTRAVVQAFPECLNDPRTSTAQAAAVVPLARLDGLVPHGQAGGQHAAPRAGGSRVSLPSPRHP